MDQKKIGLFIKHKRIEKGLTQSELANLLNVTDKAISNYENGRRIPDVSILKELSNILDVSINEILNGQVIKKSELEEKCDENIVEIINDSKINMIKILFIIFGFMFSILLIIGISLYANLNKECDPTTYDIHKYELNDLYHISIVDDLDTKYFNKKIYIQSEVQIIDNELYVQKDSINNSNKISNLVFVEPWDKVDIVKTGAYIVEIDDINQNIVIYLNFALDFYGMLGRENFVTKYTFKYQIIDNELKIELIDSYEFTEKNYSYTIKK